MAAILIQRCSASKHTGHCQNYAPCAQSVYTRGRVAATYPWDMYPQHFHVGANVVILSLLHVPTTCRLSVYKQVFVTVTCRCDMSLQHDPSCLPTFMKSLVAALISVTGEYGAVFEVHLFFLYANVFFAQKGN